MPVVELHGDLRPRDKGEFPGFVETLRQLPIGTEAHKFTETHTAGIAYIFTEKPTYTLMLPDGGAGHPVFFIAAQVKPDIIFVLKYIVIRKTEEVKSQLFVDPYHLFRKSTPV